MKKKRIELEIIALSHSVTASQNYAVVLGEKVGIRRLPIVIGNFEAQAIAVALESMSPNRPLTHDLFKNTLDVFKIELQEVVINQLEEGIFYSLLVCNNNGETIEIDARTSDAIAMAVRFNCPIFTFENIMDEAGIVLDNQDAVPQAKTNKSASQKPGYSRYTIEQLEDELKNVLEEEDYKKAAIIRDEIKKRTEGEVS
ncbi:MAG: bifunctional nuclease family protein [Saprospiraceae bacterium]|nr:bifunctional nuclease family protein [Saprospiraceae bacterium]